MTEQSQKIQNNKKQDGNAFPPLEEPFLGNEIVVHRWKLLGGLFKLINLCILVIKRKLMNSDDSKKVDKLIKELEILYNELRKLAPVEAPLITKKNPSWDWEIMGFYFRSSEYNMWCIAIEVETILCNINKYKKTDPLLKAFNTTPLLVFFEHEVGCTITDKDEIPLLRIPPFKEDPFDDELISNRWKILKSIFDLECFCKNILNCPTIDNHNSNILTNLKNELNLLHLNVGKLIPSSRPLITGGKPRYDTETKKFYYSCSKENLQKVSQDANAIIHMIEDGKEEDSSLESLNIKRLQFINLDLMSESRD